MSNGKSQNQNKSSRKSSNDRLGRCYEVAGRTVLFGNDPDIVVVHGSIQGFGNPRIDHAWVKYPDGSVYDGVMDTKFPPGVYEAFANAVENKTYTLDELRKICVSTGHWGPWE